MTEALAKPLGPWTLADLATLPEDGQRYEIIDGNLLVSPPPTILPQAIADRLHRLLVAAAGPVLEVLEGVGVQLPNGVLVPDVLVAHTAAVWSGRSLLVPADLLLAVGSSHRRGRPPTGSPSPRSMPPRACRRTGASSWRTPKRRPWSPVGSPERRTSDRPRRRPTRRSASTGRWPCDWHPRSGALLVEVSL